MDSTEELESKLSLYRTQLDQVSQLLAIEPNNSQFVTLKDDLEKVISLTETLYSSAGGNVVNFNSQFQISQPTEQPTRKRASRFGTLEPSEEKKAEETELRNDTLEDAEAEEDVNKGVRSELLPSKTGPLQVGEHVEVIGGERPFAAFVTELIAGNSKEYKLKYYEYPNDAEVSLPLSSLKRIPPGPYNLFYEMIHNDEGLIVSSKEDEPLKKKESLYLCRYSGDQQYYEAILTGKTKNGYLVTYPAYGNSEEVPVEYLKPLPVVAKMTLRKGETPQGVDVGVVGDEDEEEDLDTEEIEGFIDNKGKNMKLGKQKEENRSAIIPIPANLEILPTDTEEVKQKKRKKLKAIKNKNRIIQQEEECVEVQQSWKKFVDKVCNHFHCIVLSFLSDLTLFFLSYRVRKDLSQEFKRIVSLVVLKEELPLPEKRKFR
jgi:hypothetical protein